MDADQHAKYLSRSKFLVLLLTVFTRVSAQFQPGLKENSYGQTAEYAVQLTSTHTQYLERVSNFPPMCLCSKQAVTTYSILKPGGTNVACAEATTPLAKLLQAPSTLSATVGCFVLIRPQTGATQSCNIYC